MVGLDLGSRSRLTTSQPSSANARPTEPVPENSSSKRGIHVELRGQPDHRSKGRAAAGKLEIAQEALPERPPLRHVLIKEPRVAAPESCGAAPHWSDEFLFWRVEIKKPDRAMELQLGELQTNAREANICRSRARTPAAPRGGHVRGRRCSGSPQLTRTRAANESTLCLEASEEALVEVARWEKTAVDLAVKHGAAMFGKPLNQAQLQERFQSCLKTSAQGARFLKLKATLPSVRFWDHEGKRVDAPSSLRGRKVLVAVQPRQMWVMNQQCGLLLELRDVKLDEGVEECPL